MNRSTIQKRHLVLATAINTRLWKSIKEIEIEIETRPEFLNNQDTFECLEAEQHHGRHTCRFGASGDGNEQKK